MEYAEKISVYVEVKRKIRERDWLYHRRQALSVLQWELSTRLDKIAAEIKKL
jgi:hypothetical protein